VHAQAVILLLVGLAVLGWELHKLGHYLKQFLEVVATIAVVFATLWLLGKGLWWTAKTIVKHWRTCRARDAAVDQLDHCRELVDADTRRVRRA
jgi:sulfite exporter TauE/SafE